MARKRDTDRARHRRREEPVDLEPYYGCPADAALGLDPLGVGWLQRGQAYPTGLVSEPFLAALLPFCYDDYVVCAVSVARRCPLCNEVPPPIERDGHNAHPGTGEIRVLGETEIYAAPDLILHYISTHNYQPPEEFVQAVLLGPPAGAPEHRALVRTLNGSR
jgi:hypothetical protein